jgi:hypothetical protein
MVAVLAVAAENFGIVSRRADGAAIFARAMHERVSGQTYAAVVSVGEFDAARIPSAHIDGDQPQAGAGHGAEPTASPVGRDICRWWLLGLGRGCLPVLPGDPG